MLAVAKYRFNERELKELLASIVVITDTREQQNEHITNYFDNKGVKYERRKLDHGDYGVYLPANAEMGIMRDMLFPVAIERKNSVDELASTIRDRTRFENELIRSQQSKFMLLVEDVAGYENIIKGNYRSEYQAKALLASLKSFEIRYNFQSVFIAPHTAGNYIYHHFYYYVREALK